MPRADKWGRIWPTSQVVCVTCGQGISAGECDHKPRTVDELREAGACTILGLRVSVTAGDLVYHGVLAEMDEEKVIVKIKGDPITLNAKGVKSVYGPLMEQEKRAYR